MVYAFDGNRAVGCLAGGFNHLTVTSLTDDFLQSVVLRDAVPHWPQVKSLLRLSIGKLVYLLHWHYFDAKTPLALRRRFGMIWNVLIHLNFKKVIIINFASLIKILVKILNLNSTILN